MKFPIKLSGTGIVRRTRGRAQNSGLTKASARAMATIAKKTVMKVAETKSPIFLAQPTLTDDLVYIINPTYNITQGDTLESRDGHKIFLKNFYIKGKFTAINNATVGNGTTLIRFMIIKTDQLLTTVSNGVQLVGTSGVFRGTLGNFAARGFADLSKVKVIYDKTWKLDAQIQNSNTHIPFVINKKINRTEMFQTNPASYLKDDNYYFVFTASKTDGTVGNCLNTDFQYAVNFKDV